MSTKTQVEWRRARVLEMISKGNSQTEVAGILQVDLSIVSRDVSYLRQQAKQNIKKYIDERLPEEYEKCLVGLTSILREAWNTVTNAKEKREKIQAFCML
jgi:predicted transcriptional regulator